MEYFVEGYKVNYIKFNSPNEEIERKFRIKRYLIHSELIFNGYDFLFSYFDYSRLNKEAYLFPKLSERESCIFCLKSTPQVTFNNKPHVIPTFLGNRYLLHYEECDSCNSRFSASLEDALDKYTSIFRMLNRTRNRNKKISKITALDGKFTCSFNLKNNSFELRGESYDNYIQDDENGNLVITFDIKKHRPSDVYKGFMKIFYGLLPPEHRKYFTELRSWIMEEHSSILIRPITVIRSFLPGLNYKPLTIQIIYKKKETKQNRYYFDYVGLISFGNVVYEMPIISNNLLNSAHELRKNGKPISFNIPLFPKPFPPVAIETIDLSTTEFITDKFSINFLYSERLKNDT